MKGLISEEKKLVMSDTLEKPIPKENELLVKVVSTTLNPDDPIIASGALDEYDENLNKFKVKTGLEFSGVVEEGRGKFKVGDKVFGYVDVAAGQKAHQEYISLDTDLVAHMPKNLSFSEAASFPCGSSTVLGALRDVANLKEGERILMIGAAGGLGCFAVQMAKRIYKADITAVAGPNQEDFIKSLGADIVYDYTKLSIADIEEKFDVVFDLSTRYSYSDIKHLLDKKGVFIPVNPFVNESDFKGGTESSERSRYLFVPKGNNKDLEIIGEWAEKGIISSNIDSQYSFDDFNTALERLAAPTKQGRIVLNFDS